MKSGSCNTPLIPPCSKALDDASSQNTVLRIMYAMDRKLDDVASNQAKMLLHILPTEKYLSRPKGMPHIPLENLAALDKMEKYLEDENNLHYLVSSTT